MSPHHIKNSGALIRGGREAEGAGGRGMVFGRTHDFSERRRRPQMGEESGSRLPGRCPTCPRAGSAQPGSRLGARRAGRGEWSPALVGGASQSAPPPAHLPPPRLSPPRVPRPRRSGLSPCTRPAPAPSRRRARPGPARGAPRYARGPGSPAPPPWVSAGPRPGPAMQAGGPGRLRAGLGRGAGEGHRGPAGEFWGTGETRVGGRACPFSAGGGLARSLLQGRPAQGGR